MVEVPYVEGCNSTLLLKLEHGNSINPGYLNSDLVENLFCQQRGIRNGLNTNPTLLQYGPSNIAIILGQCSVSNKSNSGKPSYCLMPERHVHLIRDKINRLQNTEELFANSYMIDVVKCVKRIF